MVEGEPLGRQRGTYRRAKGGTGEAAAPERRFATAEEPHRATTGVFRTKEDNDRVARDREARQAREAREKQEREAREKADREAREARERAEREREKEEQAKARAADPDAALLLDISEDLKRRKNADDAAARKAHFKQLCLHWHPDKNPDKAETPRRSSRCYRRRKRGSRREPPASGLVAGGCGRAVPEWCTNLPLMPF